MYNPSLRREPLHQNAGVIPIAQESSILDWLEANGRLIARDDQAIPSYLEEEEEIPELLGVDDNDYDDIGEDEDPLALDD